MVQKHRRTGFESLVGGKKKIIETVENIDEVFVEILKDHTAGSPMDKEIKWTNLSLKEISKAFESKSMNITPHVVKQLLKKHDFVERKMQKAVTMKDCKDRNEQFEKIHELKEEYSKSENPIISMDVKKSFSVISTVMVKSIVLRACLKIQPDLTIEIGLHI